ncbi:uncharacterized protein LOC112347540 [Selaginella moellendorffii]|uniref:uncharacterized protein LOC112347540 n=1 Tax=Selaginella moellendorffii TaxID=88036 RepID=UPI000D1C9E77|nr:uncharacterized protein LOC112347540 [Selaginella moellendorffii]|eukprot:XP_024534347.1 uncharacterized protein LOC112347540 [Selaginella moellendorffii]
MVCGSETTLAKLRDGRSLAYIEYGIERKLATHKVIVIHGLASSRHHRLPCSEKVVKELGVCLVGFDRAGYGESDPNPQRSIRSDVSDIEELADHLQLGDKFYIVATSIGGYSAWGCLKYIPHRIAGVSMIAPAVNFWWPGLPQDLSKQALSSRVLLDSLILNAVHHTPWLLNWWSFPSGPMHLDEVDIKILTESPIIKEISLQATQRSHRQSLNKDMLLQFGKWEFDPLELQEPGDFRVSIWQGDRDYPVPVELQRFVHKKLPWLDYHEIAGVGHLVVLVPGYGDEIISNLVLPREI